MALSPDQMSSIPTSRVGTFTSGLSQLMGSFVAPGGTLSPDITKTRGTHVASIARIATGQFRVTLAFNLSTTIVPVQPAGSGAGQPNGLWAEPHAYITSEVLQTAPVNAAFTAKCSKFDSSTNVNNSFDVFVYNGSGTLADPAAGDRINFMLYFKQTSTLP